MNYLQKIILFERDNDYFFLIVNYSLSQKIMEVLKFRF